MLLNSESFQLALHELRRKLLAPKKVYKTKNLLPDVAIVSYVNEVQ